MRDIRFRAWDTESKHWTYGIPNHTDSKGVFRFNTGNPSFGLKVMQYTGIKDKNGTDCYEGDLIKAKNQHVYEVRFIDGSFRAYPLKPAHMYYLSELKPLEVIGNIYENPELVTPTKTEGNKDE